MPDTYETTSGRDTQGMFPRMQSKTLGTYFVIDHRMLMAALIVSSGSRVSAHTLLLEVREMGVDTMETQ